MIVYTAEELPQMSEAWFVARHGLPSASKADKILTPGGKLSSQSEAYLNQLLAERAGFAEAPMEPTPAMQDGIDREPEARALFTFETDLVLHEVGLVTNDAGTACCSPDALIGIEAGFEGKAPLAKTQFGYLRAGILPPKYKCQVHMSLAVTGLDLWYFQSYFPGLDPLIVPVERNEFTALVESALEEFLERLATESARFGLETAA